MKAPDDHESSSSDADTDIDDNLDWALDVPAVAAAAEPVPAETAAEVVQHDAKAPSLHVPICPICLDDLRVMALWICSLVVADPGPHVLTRVDQDMEVATLRCYHPFHVVCIDDWLSRQVEWESKRCPVCRAHFMEDIDFKAPPPPASSVLHEQDWKQTPNG